MLERQEGVDKRLVLDAQRTESVALLVVGQIGIVHDGCDVFQEDGAAVRVADLVGKLSRGKAASRRDRRGGREGSHEKERANGGWQRTVHRLAYTNKTASAWQCRWCAIQSSRNASEKSEQSSAADVAEQEDVQPRAVAEAALDAETGEPRLLCAQFLGRDALRHEKHVRALHRAV